MFLISLCISSKRIHYEGKTNIKNAPAAYKNIRVQVFDKQEMDSYTKQEIPSTAGLLSLNIEQSCLLNNLEQR